MPKKPPKKIKLIGKNFFFIIMFLSLLSGLYCVLFWTPPGKTKLKIKNKTYTLEIAKTTAQKSKGLSKRQDMCSSCGMIFVYTFEQILPFWMKDTYLSLDLIWLDQEGRIVHLEKTIPPESKNDQGDYRLYTPPIQAQYVIELLAGQIDHLHLKTGDLIDLSSLTQI